MPLIEKVDRELAIDLELFSRGGQEILNAIERRDYAVLGRRPAISKARKLALVPRAAAGKMAMSTARAASSHALRADSNRSLRLRTQFAATSRVRPPRISTTHFLVLPRPKRQALCAVYAFMRRCDDIADDEISVTYDERQYKLATWLDAFHRAQAGQPTDEPVLLALTDAQRRYNIRAGFSISWLMARRWMSNRARTRIASESPVPYAITVHYRTFDDLYQYCYRVASVVGLVCIHVFGYRDPAPNR